MQNRANFYSILFSGRKCHGNKFMLLLFCMIYASSPIIAQLDPDNAEKYEHYRERFDQYYIVIGSGKGASIPFSTRRYTDGVHELRTGESTFMLGSYIAMLALEYERNRRDLSRRKEIVRDLYYALEAINRLDYYAETYIPNQNFAPELNGFFVREDIPNGFLERNKGQLNEGLAKKNKGSGYVKGRASVLPVSRNREERKMDSQSLPHRNMSQDHAIRLLWGLYAVQHFVEETETFKNEAFLDKETRIQQEAINIIDRMIQYFEENRWKILRPDGERVRRGSSIYIFKGQLKRMYKNLQQAKQDNTRKELNFSYGFFNRGILGVRNANAWMNGRMQMETQNLSGNPYRVWQRCYDFGYETYFIPYGVLIHGWSLKEKRSKMLQQTMEFYLNMAPCEGNFYHSESDFSSYGWATPDRTERPLNDTYFGIFEKGNYSGLDYLLMYNLYQLMFGKEGNGARNSNVSCKEDCRYVNQKVKQRELDRALKMMKKSEVTSNASVIKRLRSQCQ